MASLPKEFISPFSKYKVIKVLGEGGAGRVFHVVNADGDEFALKCLLPERVTDERRKRFKNEVAFCQNSIHPHVVRVLDIGAVEVRGATCPFYVMPLYKETLRDLIAAGISHKDVLTIFRQLLDGVEAAHLKKVWHRDLKPENVLYDRKENRLVIADFGIARFEDFEHATVVETKAGTKLANLRYSAPEQRIKGATVDQRADIYALGLMLNEMFTGNVLQGIGYKTIGSVVPDFAYLDQIVEVMVQDNPAARAGSIDQIKKELIARGQEWIAFQRVDELSRQVVPKYAAGEIPPVSVIAFDIQGPTMTLQLNRAPDGGWVQSFQFPKSGYSNRMGYGPESYNFRGDKAVIGNVRDEETAQVVIDQFKNFSAMATRQYQDELSRAALMRQQEEIRALKIQQEEAERRRRILQKIKI